MRKFLPLLIIYYAKFDPLRSLPWRTLFWSCSKVLFYPIGFALGSGAAIGNQLAEGRHSAARLVKRAEQLGITMPICEAVNLIVNHGAGIPQTIAGLLARETGTE